MDVQHSHHMATSSDQGKALTDHPVELINIGNKYLKQPSDRTQRKDLMEAQKHFSKVIEYYKADPSTPLKQVSRICQKLMETSIRLSMAARQSAERQQHADQAREYGEKLLANARMSQDDCMVAQAEFMLACVGVWNVYVAASLTKVEPCAHPKCEAAEVMLEHRLNELRQYPHLDMETYEGQARNYQRYLKPR